MRGRSIAPDLARGAMLLLIAIANAPMLLWGYDSGLFGGHSLDGTVADRIAQTISITAIDGRVYPMFALLFGYGIVQLYTRQTAAGVDPVEARRLLRRRHWWMVAFGFVHAALLWYGDILGTYGLVGLLLVWLFLDRGDRTIRRWVIWLTSLMTAVMALAAIGAFLGGASMPVPSPGGGVAAFGSSAEPNYLVAAAKRIGEWALFNTPAGLFGMVVPIAVLIGFLAARHKVLDRPSEHLRLLKRTAVIGLTIGLGTGLVTALQNLDVWGLGRSYDPAFVCVQYLGGLFGGVGYVALFGLIAARLERDRQARGGSTGPISDAVQALGKRSLSGYLAQSVVLAPVLCAWGLGLGSSMTSWSVTVLAIAIWIATVVAAAAYERAGKRGPAERLLRYLAYPRPRTAPTGMA